MKLREHREPVIAEWLPGTLMVITAATLVWTRLVGLDVSMWHDEVRSIVDHAEKGPRGVFLEPYLPVNHMLYNLLAWATSLVLGATERAYRLWSVLPGMAAVGIVGTWLWIRANRWTAVAAVVLATTAPWHLNLVPQARGYGLAYFACALMLVSAIEAHRRQRKGALVLFAVAAFVGVTSFPIVLLAVLPHAVVFFVDPRIRKNAFVILAAAGFATLAFYAPVITELYASSDQVFGTTVPWHGVVTGPYRYLFAPSVNRLFTDATAVGVTAFVVTTGFGIWELVRTQRRWMLAHLLAPVMGTFALLAITNIWIVTRYVSFLLFYVMVIAAVGIVAAVRALPPVRYARGAATAALVALTLFALVKHERLAAYYARVPWEAFAMMGEVVDSASPELVLSNTARLVGVEYYVDKPVVVIEEADFESKVCRADRPFVFIDHSFMSWAPDTTCLAENGGSRIRLRQRGRGRRIDVWIVPAAPGTASTAP